jgi:hypothetical protein
MAIELPRRFTRTWIDTHVPNLSYRDADLVLAAMRAKGWSEDELRARVYPLLRGSATRLATRPGQTSPKRRWFRRPMRLAELSAVAGILGSLSAVLALFGPFGGGGSKVIYATPSAVPTTAARNAPARSDNAENTLLSGIPAGVRSSCNANEDLRKRYGAVAAYRCDLAGADQVAYYTFRNAAGVSRAYSSGSPIRLSAGGCGKHWNVESGYHTPKSNVDVGSLRCFTYKGTASIEWTRDDMNLYAYASRNDGNRKQLFTAWNSAGPTP